MKNKRGSALVAVFWIMAILGLAIVASLRVISYQIQVVGAQTDGLEARQLAERGIAVGSNPRVTEYDPLLHMDFENGGGFDVQIFSEAARFNINYILLQDDRRLLRHMFAEWGIDFEVARDIADALGDWIDRDHNEKFNGAEVDWYTDNGFANRPYNRPFYNLDEMRLVKGMNIVESFQPAWRDWFTVYSSGGLDVNEARAELLAVAVEGNIEAAREFVGIVNGPDGIQNTEDDQPFQNLSAALEQLGIASDEQDLISRRFSTGDEPVVRIESTGFIGDVKRKIILILQNRTRGTPTILDRIETNG